MEKLLADVQDAVNNLRTVAKHLHTPLDTSTVDKALKALSDELLKKKPTGIAAPAADM
jgi:signal transduction histidine kinase